MSIFRRDRLIWENLRHPTLLTILMEERTHGKNCVGSKRVEYMGEIVKDVGYGRYANMKK